MESLGQPYELIVVDDGSTDATRPRLRDLTVELRALRIVQLRTNFGQTAALAAGFDLARGALIITLDGDGQNDPADIPRLVDKLKEGYDVVSGWRHDRQDSFWSRRLPSRVANALISWITGVRLHDYGCALKVYRREILQDVALYGEMHRFLPALCRWVGATVGELPVSHWPRRRGVSKYGLGRMVRVLLDLLTVKFLMSYWTRPIQIFGLLGLVLGGLGIGLGAVLSYQKIFHGMGLANRPLLLLAVLLVLVGFQFVSIGLLGEMLVRTYHESQRKPVYTVREIISGGHVMIRSSRLVRDVCLGLALLAAAGCGGGSSSSTSSSSQAAADFDFGGNNPRKVTAFGDSITQGVLELRAPRLRPEPRATTTPTCSRRVSAAWTPPGPSSTGAWAGRRRRRALAACRRSWRSTSRATSSSWKGTNDAHRLPRREASRPTTSARWSRSRRRAGQSRSSGRFTPNFRNDPCGQDVSNKINVLVRGIAAAENIIARGDLRRHERPLALRRQPRIATRSTRTRRATASWRTSGTRRMVQAVPGGATAALRRRR